MNLYHATCARATLRAAYPGAGQNTFMYRWAWLILKLL
jgi:hypothetical protein